MNKIALSACAIVAAALQLGCAQSPWRSQHALVRPTCASDNNCRIPVYVAADPQSQACVVLISFEEVHIGRGKKPLIVWELDQLDPSDGYEYQFASDGIYFKASIAPDDFTPGPPMGSGKFSWRSVNGKAGSFDYGVKVQRRPAHHGNWDACPTLDPKIVNDGP